MRSAVLTTIATLSLAVIFSSTSAASSYPITNVPSVVPPSDAEKLEKAGVKTSDDLVAKAAKPKDRKGLSKSTGIPAPTLLTLAQRADLLRISGVGPEMVLLLDAAGVHTAAELAKKDASSLVKAMLEANQDKKISAKPPTEPQVEYWITEAKKLPPGVVDGK